MLIQNESKMPVFPQADRPAPVREGGIYNAVVKQRLPNNEALLQIKDQEIKVKFEGRFPASKEK